MKIQFKYQMANDRWIGERLYFQQDCQDNWMIINFDEQLIGNIEKERVGKFMHWVLFLEDRCYLSVGCLDEVREFMKKCYSLDKSSQTDRSRK